MASVKPKILNITPISIERFGGLDVFHDPQEIGWAVAADGINFDATVPGKLMPRPGYDDPLITSIAASSGFAAASGEYIDAAGNDHLIVGTLDTATPKIKAYSSGTLITSATTNGAMNGAELIGTPTSDRLYIVTVGTDTVWRYTQATGFTQPAGMPVPKFLTQTRTNRLVMANLSTGTSTVSFSPAGNPEGAVAGSVDLAPGDGSAITGVAKWHDSVFIFKRNRFFVFGNETVDAQGNPEFNNYRVEGYGSRASVVFTNWCVGGLDGVYFFDGNRIYRTRGEQTPVRISEVIEPFLQKQVAIAGYTIQGYRGLYYSLGKLYMAVQLTNGAITPDACVVYDETTKVWMLWDIPTNTIDNYQGNTLFRRTTGSTHTFNKIRAGTDLTTAGTQIAWSYQTGYTSPGVDRRVMYRDSSIWGTGTVTQKMLTRGARTGDITDPGDAVTLGASSVAEGKRRRGVRGVLFASRVSGSGTASNTSITRQTHRFYGRGLDS